MTAIPKEVRDRILERDGRACSRCGRTIENFSHSLHHRQGRGGDSPHVAENLVTLCGSGTSGCHGYVHAHPDYSYKSGFMVRRIGIRKPSEIPIINLLGESFTLTSDYRRI